MAGATSHRHGDLIRMALEAISRGNLEMARERVLASNVRWHEPGRNVIAGDYTGADEVILHFFSRLMDLTDWTFRMQLEHVIAEHGRVTSFHVARALRDGKLLESEDVGLFAIENGRIRSARVYHADQHEWDRFWS